MKGHKGMDVSSSPQPAGGCLVPCPHGKGRESPEGQGVSTVMTHHLLLSHKIQVGISSTAE
jgi:hypothetical protein